VQVYIIMLIANITIYLHVLSYCQTDTKLLMWCHVLFKFFNNWHCCI